MAFVGLATATASAQGDSLNEALDNPGMTFTTGGETPWKGLTTVSHDGTDAASSGVIGDGQMTWMQTTVVGPGYVSFWWKVSSEKACDKLSFLIDGVAQYGIFNGNYQTGFISGTTDWELKSYFVPAGSRTLSWRYRKDQSISSGDDAAWVDQVVFSNGPEILVQSVRGGEFVDGMAKIGFGKTKTQGTIRVMPFVIKNVGFQDLTNITISIDGENASDFSVAKGEITSLAPSETRRLIAKFNPKGAGRRSAVLHIASNDPDESPFDIMLTGTGTAPEIAVEAPLGTKLIDGAASIACGPASPGNSSPPVTVVIKNLGLDNLTGLALTKDGTHNADFNLSRLGATTLSPGATTSFTVTFVPGAEGARTATIRLNSNDADENPFDIVLEGMGSPPLDKALDTSGLVWSSGGDASWFGQTTISQDGDDSAQSGKISNSQSCWTETTVEGPGTLTFWWKVSSEERYDYLEFYDNGVLQEGRISGEEDWSKNNFTLAEGIHVLRWRYKKDGSVSKNLDAGWIDRVTYVPALPSVNKVPTKAVRKSPLNANRIPEPSIPLNVKESVRRLTPVGSAKSTKPSTFMEFIDDQKFLVLQVAKANSEPNQRRVVEVSSDLVNWYSGKHHTTVLINDANLLKVRDNTPMRPGTKRYIRLN
jgi:hypothetical protein